MFGLLRRVFVAVTVVAVLSGVLAPAGAQEDVGPPDVEGRVPVPERPTGDVAPEDPGRVLPPDLDEVPPGANRFDAVRPLGVGDVVDVIEDVPRPDVEAELARPGLGVGRGELDVRGGKRRVPGTPLEFVLGPRSDARAVRAVRAEVFDPVLVDQVSSLGAAVALDFVGADGGRRQLPGSFVAEFDLDDVALPDVGGLWGRLELVWLSDCHVSSDGDRVKCGASQRLDTEIDRDARLVRAQVNPSVLAGDLESARRDQIARGVPEGRVRPDVAAEVELPPVLADDVEPAEAAEEPQLVGSAGGGGFAMMALSAGSLGPEGDYAAPSLSSAGSFGTALWQGSATYSIPIDVPAAAAGATPYVGLEYSSGSVDGMTGATNNQSGPVGLGWSLVVGGAINEHFEACEYGDADNGEVCVDGDDTGTNGRSFSLSLHGRSGRLIPTSTTNEFRLQNDPYWKVRKRTNASVPNVDSGNEYWEVTTPEGTVYRFGWNADAADYRPVHYDTGTSGCSGTNVLCDQVYRWNLDRVTDVYGNEIHYSWRQEVNRYDSNAGKRAYVAASGPAEVRYTEGTQDANARVVFNWEQRCRSTGSGTWGECGTGNYVDSPSNLFCGPADTCTENAASFFTMLRLGSIQTQVYGSGTGSNFLWRTLRTYDLIQNFPTPPGGVTEAKMLLMRLFLREGSGTGDASYEHWGFAQIDAEDYDAKTSGLSVAGAGSDYGGGQRVAPFTGAGGGTEWLRFDDVWFGGASSVTTNKVYVRVRTTSTGARLRLRKDSATGTANNLALVNLPNTNGDWQTVEFDVSGITADVHDLYLVTNSAPNSGEVRVNWLRFRPSSYAALATNLPYEFRHVDSSAGASDGWVWLENRRNSPVSGGDMMELARMSHVLNPLGGRVHWSYGQTHPCDPELEVGWNNDEDCFPVALGLDSGGNIQWVPFRKYKVTRRVARDDFNLGVSGTPGVGSSPQIIDYEYTAPKWGFAHSPTTPCDRTAYNDFRGHRRVTEILKGFDDNNTEVEFGRRVTRFFTGLDDEPNQSNCSGSKNEILTLRNGSNDWPSTSPGEDIIDRYEWRGQVLEVAETGVGGGSHWRRTVTRPASTVTFGSGFDAAVATQTIDTWSFARTSASAEAYTRQSATYNATYGGLATVTDYGVGGQGGDNTFTVFNLINDTGQWMLGLPYEARTYEGLDSNGTEIARSRWYYDEQGFGGTNPTHGAVTRTVQYHNVAAGQGFSTHARYDTQGRLNKSWDGNAPTPNLAETNQTTAYGFDTRHGNVIWTDNAFGWRTNYGYDSWRRLNSVTDVNFRATTATYDGHQRLLTVTEPGHTGTPTRTHVYADTVPATVTTRHKFAGSATLNTVDFYDGFGRVFQTDSPNPQANGYTDRTIVRRDFDWDGSVERETAPFNATGAAGATQVNPDWTTVLDWVENDYNGSTGRTTSNKMAGATVEWQTTIRHRGENNDNALEEYVDAPAPENGAAADQRRHTTRVSDARGNLVQVIEHDNPTTADATTVYGYDRRNRLITVNPPGPGANLSILYDDIDRKTTLIDPDAGTWTYTYDSNGNLKTQDSPTGDDLWFDYDLLNRPTFVRVDNSSGAALKVFTYDHLGGSGTGDDQRGRLYQAQSNIANPAEVWDNTFTYLYDARGRVTSERLLTETADGTDVHLEMAFTYGDGDQLLTVSYPNTNTSNYGTAETVTYTYDNATGSLLTAQSSDSDSFRTTANTTYNFAGQVTSMQLNRPGTGTDYRVTNNYNDRLQLERTRAGTTGDHDLYVDIGYRYDHAGNIAAAIDQRNPDTTSGSHQANCYHYDSRDRLTRAYTNQTSTNWDGALDSLCDGTPSITGGGGTAEDGTGYDRTYTYEANGNLKTLNENYNDPSTTANDIFTRTYTYGAGNAGPAAVTSIAGTGASGAMAFTYDNAGNMITRDVGNGPTQTLSYNQLGQLAEVDITPDTPTGGNLRVTTSPPRASMISIDGQEANQWGIDWLDLPAGSYEVCFSDMPGNATPDCETAVVPNNGTTVAVQGDFVAKGTLDISTSPVVDSTILIDGVAVKETSVVTDLDPGTYEVCWTDLATWDAPACQYPVVSASQTTVVTGTFTAGTNTVPNRGQLRVTTNPAMGATIYVDGKQTDQWSLEWPDTDAGTYEICFSDMPGYITPPCENAVVTAGLTAVVTGDYEATGTIQVVTEPPVDAPITIDGHPRNQWGVGANIDAGTYDICANFYTGPTCATAEVVDGEQTTVTLQHPGINQTTYRYDTNGIRVRTTVDGFYDTIYMGQWYELDDTGITTTHYRIGGQHIATKIVDPRPDPDLIQLDYIFTDHLGTTRATTGDQPDQDNYHHPYGTPRDNTGTTHTTRDYTGQHRDPTGLHYYNARYYDPHTGRFTQPDTIIPNPTNPQDFNRYTYVRNNPIRYNDPTGNSPCRYLEADSGTSQAECRGFGGAGLGGPGEFRHEPKGAVAVSPLQGGVNPIEDFIRHYQLSPVHAAAGLVAAIRNFEETAAALKWAALNPDEAVAAAVRECVSSAAGAGQCAGGAALGAAWRNVLRHGRSPDADQLALPPGRFTNANFAPGKLESHYLKHRDEYGAIGIDAYLARARSLLSTDVGDGILGFTRTNGDTVRFNGRTGEFAVGAADGTIRTLFRPDDGLAYYLEQVPE